MDSDSLGNPAAFELQSLVDSHDRPFVVIDKDYRIVAINDAYRKQYGLGNHLVIGKECFRISHHNSTPCCNLGEDCPHEAVFRNGNPGTCIHVHYDQEQRMRQVRVKAFPLRGADGALYLGELLEEIIVPHHPFPSAMKMVGQASPFRDCIEQLKLVAATHPPVLLQGETGTGKELAARFIHEHSPRRDRPFMTVDCTTLAETLFEAEMFGHTRGAYTGSVGEKPGLFEEADGGTLFLDEIGDMPMSQQSKLLRILDTGQFRRVGGRNMRKVDVRIISASNRQLWDAVREGLFREDLYYRIACLTVRMPTLRERMEDIHSLAQHMLESFSITMQRNFRLSEDAVVRLRAYDYPGNIRELKNILYVAATQNGHDLIDGAQIELVINQILRSRARQPGVGAMAEESGLSEQPELVAVQPSVASLQDNEARHISALLGKFDGNRARIAKMLGISERTLYRKLRKYSLS